MTEADKAALAQEHIATMSANFDKVLAQCAGEIEKVRVLREALRDLLEDTQHSKHHCGDGDRCPVTAARQAMKATAPKEAQ